MFLRQILRNLRQAPLLNAVIVASLAIGIGANTVIFSWLKGSYFQPLPGVTAPVRLLETKDDTGNYVSTSWLEYQDLTALLPSFELIAAQRIRTLNLGHSEREAVVFAELVSGNFFRLLGVAPQLGRFFQTDEAAHPGAAPVAVISHDFWQRHFKGATDILGLPLVLNGRSLTVIGVAPAGFHGGYNNLSFDVFLPATMAQVLIPASSELTHRENRPYVMLARLKPGVTPDTARRELTTAAGQLLETHPETNRGLSYELLSPWRSPRGGETAVRSLVLLQVFGALILIIVCANTATLLLARATTRRREIGVRLALGAGPARVILQLLGESVGVALLGAAGGLLVSLWGVDALARLPTPGGLPLHFVPELDGMSLAFAALLGSACGVTFGLVPALQLVHGDILQALRGERGSVGGRSRLRDLLVGLEVALALVVLVLGGLYYQSYRNSLRANPGFDTSRVMLAGLDLGGRGYTAKTGGALLDSVLQSLAASPGVAQVAAANYVPLDLRGIPTGVISIAGKEFDPNRKILYYQVTAGYLATMGIPLIAGTDLAPREKRDLPLDAIIDEEMARRYWPGENPVGHRFEVNGDHYVIAGVARTPKLEQMNESPRPAAWLSMRSQFVSQPVLHVRAREGDPAALLPVVRDVIRHLDPEISLLDTRTLARHVENNLFMHRVPAQLLAVLGPLALALAATGLYAVLSYSVGQRTQEIGVRLTLGATPGSVIRLMLWQSLRVVFVSSACGWFAALFAGWYLQGRLVGVAFGDPVIYAAIPTFLIAVAVLACWLPARRAAKVDPMVALRSE